MKSIYFKLVCLFILLFVVCCSAEIFVNKYAYEKGKPIKNIKIPDIIQESIPIIRNLDVVSDLFVSFFHSFFVITQGQKAYFSISIAASFAEISFYD